MIEPEHVLDRAKRLHNEAKLLRNEGKLDEAIETLIEALKPLRYRSFEREWIEKDLARYRRLKEQTSGEPS